MFSKLEILTKCIILKMYNSFYARVLFVCFAAYVSVLKKRSKLSAYIIRLQSYTVRLLSGFRLSRLSCTIRTVKLRSGSPSVVARCSSPKIYISLL